MNRGQRRLARMTGRAEPSSRELKANLHRRILAVEGPEGLAKRYNRQGLTPAASSEAETNDFLVGGGKAASAGKAATTGKGAVASFGQGAVEKATNKKGKGKAKGGAAAAAAAAAAAGAAASGSTVTATGYVIFIYTDHKWY